ncbi:hypothetical protein [Haladaptatus halobius]|uniref:hypothetical protein n=1 Tax=Haladaptatus halobius TaxID=2884875 RepID=UPI001D0BA733|nr:hypothetical protein [Haladaptatus halobius]
MERIWTTLDAVEDDELPDETAESMYETVDAINEEVTNASLDELLTATGFANESDDVAPADLPMMMEDADSDAVLSLRRQ